LVEAKYVRYLYIVAFAAFLNIRQRWPFCKSKSPVFWLYGQRDLWVPKKLAGRIHIGCLICVENFACLDGAGPANGIPFFGRSIPGVMPSGDFILAIEGNADSTASEQAIAMVIFKRQVMRPH